MLDRELEFKKESKRTGIVCMGTRISLSSKNVRSVDLVYFRNILQDIYGRKVDYLSLKSKKEADLDYFKNISDVDINDYDEIFIYNHSYNPFGGLFKSEAIVTFKKLFDFKGDIWYLLLDPKMPCTDFAAYLKTRIVDEKYIKTDSKEGRTIVTPEFCDKWSAKVYPKIKIAMGGCNYNAYYTTYMNKVTKNGKKEVANRVKLNPNYEWAFIPLFEYYAVKEDLDKKLKDYNFDQREYDLVYFGNNRQTERNRIINNFYDDIEFNNIVFGFDPNWEYCSYEYGPYVSHDDMFRLIPENAKATLVLGDNLHNNNIRTPRFFESMLLDVVAFIYIEYDKEKRFIKNEFLREFCYVDSPQDLKRKYRKIVDDEELFRKIVKLQREEILSQFEMYK
ncbi:MAG: glycosyltransferase family 1 protein [Clostridia bacterium]|nr:glycosyltransferase family 1 protein [Clostridia bacterium]